MEEWKSDWGKKRKEKTHHENRAIQQQQAASLMTYILRTKQLHNGSSRNFIGIVNFIFMYLMILTLAFVLYFISFICWKLEERECRSFTLSLRVAQNSLGNRLIISLLITLAVFAFIPFGISFRMDIAETCGRKKDEMESDKHTALTPGKLSWKSQNSCSFASQVAETKRANEPIKSNN